MLEQKVRQQYQYWLVDPVANWAQKKLAAAQITLSALVVGIMVVPALYYHHQYIAVALLLLSGYFDTLDGTVARLEGVSSSLGAVYDIMADRIVEFSAVFGLYLVDPGQRGLMCLLMLGSIMFCVTSFLVVGIFTANNSQKSFYYSPGLIERAEAIILFILMMLVPNVFWYITPIFIMLVGFTTLVRLYEFKIQQST
jgi:phosphatidylglycerophosphate synthase